VAGRARLAGALASLALLGVLAAPLGASTTTTTLGDAHRTLLVNLPGPFTGCTYLDRGASASDAALLDLVRPSAFWTNPNGNLAGEGGAVTSAELTSLSPQTVVYTLAPRLAWSDGTPFTGADLVAWWQRARALPSVLSDGYRDLASLKVSRNGLTVTATFSAPYGEWNSLFRDMERRGSSTGCGVSQLVARPSLGPYRVVSATPTRIELVANPAWPLDLARFGRVVVRAGSELPANVATPFATYMDTATDAAVRVLGAHPTVLSHLGSSTQVAELLLSPQGPTAALTLRQALSWSLDRQSLINRLWGAITFSPAAAASAIFSQGQNAYPGGSGTGPSATTTTSTTLGPHPSTLADCPACARAVLLGAHYRLVGGRWVTPAGGYLSVRLGRGPGPVDLATAAEVVRQWRAFGVTVRIVAYASDPRAAEAAAAGRVSVALVARPTSSSPSYAARSWAGPAYYDTYPGGFRARDTAAFFHQAITNFNAASAVATWLAFDRLVMRRFWARPLYTVPSLVEWSPSLAGVNGSLSVAGFADEVTGWSTQPRGS
jgi:peptide/nickel transport system substrate-binding protein